MSDTQKISAETSGRKVLTIVPADGLTVDEVIRLLNEHHAFLQGKQIVQPYPPPAEGFSIIAEVAGIEETPLATAWEAVEESHGGCQCCPTEPEDIMLSQAERLVNLAHGWAGKKRGDLASKLLIAAEALLRAAGKENTATEVWLLTGQALVLIDMGDKFGGASFLERAYQVGLKAFDGDPVGTAVVGCNLGEGYADIGRTEDAAKLLSEGLAVLRDPASVSAQYPQSYLSGAAAGFEAVLAKITPEQSSPAAASDSDAEQPPAGNGKEG